MKKRFCKCCTLALIIMILLASLTGCWGCMIKAEKPVIYLYPEETTEVTVKINPDNNIICSYPKYNSGWNVIAEPDGTLTDGSGRTYSYLYWEGDIELSCDWKEGFCIPGEDTAEFLEEILADYGLNDKESDDFITYWLPQMQDSKYNLISFQTEKYEGAVNMEISPAPDTTIRVFMIWKPLDEPVTITPQVPQTIDRSGFSVVEWGGSRMD